MKKRHVFMLLTGSETLVALLIGLVLQSFTSFIDTVFILGLLTLVVGAWLYILDQGFFRIMNYGFKKLRRHLPFISKMRDSDEVFQELHPEQDLYTVKQHRLTLPILLSGVGLVGLSYASLLFL